LFYRPDAAAELINALVAQKTGSSGVGAGTSPS